MSPPSYIEISEISLADLVPPLEAADEGSSCGRRLRSYRSMRHVWRAFMMWLLLLAISLTNSSVGDKPSSFERMFGNSTLFPDLEHHFNRINNSLNRGMMLAQADRQLPGTILAKQGARPAYHIVMIPGFVTSGLEVWSAEQCAQKYFRQRIWGALVQARGFFTERDCWRKHLSLDPYTGGDPKNIKLRAAQGFDAADYFLTAYWVWDKLISNLAEVGYDGSNMSMFTYDWRLAFPLLEERDGYFTKLKAHIEATHKTSGKKVLLAAHSMGSQVITYFFAWVTSPESKGGGGGGAKWVDEHIHSFVNIAGPMLGVSKAIPSILSGEMKDTNVMMGTFGSMVENFFGRKLRKDLWSSWGSLWSMLPKGGDAIWGPGVDLCNETAGFNGQYHCNSTKAAPFLSFTDPKETSEKDKDSLSATACNVDSEHTSAVQKTISEFSEKKEWTLEETIDFMQTWGAGLGSEHASTRLLSFKDGDGKPEKASWHDPTRTALPHAPNMKVYCLYGVGLPTERSFFYKRNMESKEVVGSESVQQCAASPADLPFIMDGNHEDAEHNVHYGVTMTDGDASVPLLSLGYMCVEGWKTKKLNPSGSPVVTREYPHQQEFTVEDPMRGGPLSADHVDILGNHKMMYDFLKIATDFHSEELKDQIHSDITNLVSRIRSHPVNMDKDHRSKRRTSRKSLHSFVKNIFKRRRNSQRT